MSTKEGQIEVERETLVQKFLARPCMKHVVEVWCPGGKTANKKWKPKRSRQIVELPTESKCMYICDGMSINYVVVTLVGES